MRKIRVLVVDDAVVVRKIVTDTLSTDSELEVAGVAANGRIALQKIPQVNPDIITLDIEMPEMDGLTALTEIRKTYPLLPVIMFSAFTQRGAAKTLEALSLGASDYVTKPSNMGSVPAAMQRIRDDLIPKIKTFCAKNTGVKPPPRTLPDPSPVKTAAPLKHGKLSPSLDHRLDVVAIGVSTGGPNALAGMMPVFPENFPVPIVIVQHMPPFFTKLLADRLSAKSSIEILEGTPGTRLEPGKAWIAPGDYHMVLVRRENDVIIETHQDPPENSCRPSVDVLFRSVVKVYGGRTLGVVLTGMGQDGLIGCKTIKDGGGQVVAQDEATSVVWGMPGFVVKAGLADKILPLNEVGPEIINRLKKGRTPAAS